MARTSPGARTARYGASAEKGGLACESVALDPQSGFDRVRLLVVETRRSGGVEHPIIVAGVSEFCRVSPSRARFPHPNTLGISDSDDSSLHKNSRKQSGLGEAMPLPAGSFDAA